MEEVAKEIGLVGCPEQNKTQQKIQERNLRYEKSKEKIGPHVAENLC